VFDPLFFSNRAKITFQSVAGHTRKEYSRRAVTKCAPAATDTMADTERTRWVMDPKSLALESAALELGGASRLGGREPFEHVVTFEANGLLGRFEVQLSG
jgi:hypothetical protein